MADPRPARPVIHPDFRFVQVRSEIYCLEESRFLERVAGTEQIRDASVIRLEVLNQGDSRRTHSILP